MRGKSRRGGSKDGGSGITLCSDIQSIGFSAERTRIPKQAGESGLGAFRRWAKDQANAWCESGHCSKGRCQGFLQEISVTILEETPEYVDVRYSFRIVCDCA
jgi:hypothetical protein